MLRSTEYTFLLKFISGRQLALRKYHFKHSDQDEETKHFWKWVGWICCLYRAYSTNRWSIELFGHETEYISFNITYCFSAVSMICLTFSNEGLRPINASSFRNVVASHIWNFSTLKIQMTPMEADYVQQRHFFK